MLDQILAHHAEEHCNVKSLLRILDRQLASIESGGCPDYHLMQDIMQYLTRHPGRHNHSQPDQMVGGLTTIRSELSGPNGQVCTAHRILAAAGYRYLALIEQIINGCLVARDSLITLGRNYVDSYITHIHCEEKNLLGQCAVSLDSADWMILMTTCQRQSEPQFPHNADQAYQHLRECITLEGAGPWPWTNISNRTCLVCARA